jgi:hypothetical protein
MQHYDVYTLMRSRKKAPSLYCFAVKAQSPESSFENKPDYVRFFCVETLDKMKDWILSIRNMKSRNLAQALDLQNVKADERSNRTQVLN